MYEVHVIHSVALAFSRYALAQTALATVEETGEDSHGLTKSSQRIPGTSTTMAVGGSVGKAAVQSRLKKWVQIICGMVILKLCHRTLPRKRVHPTHLLHSNTWTRMCTVSCRLDRARIS